MSGPAPIKPAYLIAGGDEAKIEAALKRLRDRAEREGGPGALELFAPVDGQGAPDAEALITSFGAMSLTAERRYLVADRIDRWSAAETTAIVEALASIPDGVTVVLVARGKVARKLPAAVESAGGEVLSYEAPKARQLPSHLVTEARARGFELEPDAARLLVDRMGTSTARLGTELDRLSLWAGEEGEVSVSDLDAILADTSDAALWELSDALVEGHADEAALVAERLVDQGESLTHVIYSVASRLRDTHRALSELEAGKSQSEVEAGMRMHPWAAKQLVRRARNASVGELREAIAAIADLEYHSRGGSDYDAGVAFTLAMRRAVGAGDEASR